MVRGTLKFTYRKHVLRRSEIDGPPITALRRVDPSVVGVLVFHHTDTHI